jgi:rhodanese-related sulfurtransferase
MSTEQFVALVTTDQPLMPDYFGYNAVLNQRLHPIWKPAKPQGMTFPQLYRAMWDGAVVLDSRDASDHAAGHVRGSISVPLDGRFAETVGMLLRPDRDIVVVAPEGREAETIKRLSRIGFDRVVGHLSDVERVLTQLGDFYVGRASRLTPAAVDALIADHTAGVQLVDVRNPGEVAAGEIAGAQHVPLPQLRRRLAEVPRDRPVVLYCASGWRSAVAASYLRSQGYPDVSDVIGGYGGWVAHHMQPAVGGAIVQGKWHACP